MAVEPGYTVLPVSALKEQAKVVFEALKKGQIVYVANRGRVIAAFRPYTFVPDAVAALYTSPYLDLPTVTARDLGRGIRLSKVVTEAAEGLPSIVEKDRRIYGILTPATAPEPSEIPDPESVGAKAEAVRKYREANPDATIDQIMDYSNSLDESHEDVGAWREWPLSDQVAVTRLEDDATINDELELWRDQGSDVEDVVHKVFASLDEAIPAGAGRSGFLLRLLDGSHRVSALLRKSAVPDLAVGSRSVSVKSAVPDLVVGSRPVNFALAGRETVLGGEKLEADGKAVQARTSYVIALTADQHPNVGAMWRLGNLARSVGHSAEAARWFRLSLVVDALDQTLRTRIANPLGMGIDPAKGLSHSPLSHSDAAVK